MANFTDDDVSALTFGGASAIAMKQELLLASEDGFISRLRKNFADMHMDIPEDDDHATEDDGVGSRNLRRQAQHSWKDDDDRLCGLTSAVRNSGEENEVIVRIEPMPKTLEEWRKKNKKSHKRKSKKHRKRSSKKHDKEHEETNGAAPLTEICIRSERTSHATDVTDSPDRRYCPSVASTAESSNSRSGNLSSTRRSFADDSARPSVMSGSGGAGERIHHPSVRSHEATFRSSSRSRDSCDSLAHTAFSSTSQSYIITQLKAELEQAKEAMEHSATQRRLEAEVAAAKREAEWSKEHQQNVDLELRLATEERERLKMFVDKMEEENSRLRVALRNREEKEAEKRLDHVMNSMEARMKALMGSRSMMRSRRSSSQM